MNGNSTHHFQRHHQEIIFPAAFVYPVCEIAEVWHTFERTASAAPYKVNKSYFTPEIISMHILTTAGLIAIKDRKILLAFSNNKQAFYLPGGKADEGESTENALLREISEELNITLDPEKIRFYTHVTAPAFGELNGIVMEQDCFLCDLHEQPTPAAEIGDLRYFNTHSYKDQPKQVPGVVMVMHQLRTDGLID
jgi:8-oxo-dGTP pyrophosphatase MutT (NUDIX family)